MTHAREKSDEAIVAAKPANNAERSAAEPVERRAEAEGNASQQSTGRMPSRGTVTHALDRIRRTASERKKERFTALFHHVNIEHLADAFDELKPDAAAGVDGVTWEAYEADLERNLEDLHGRLHSGSVSAAALPAGLHSQTGRAAAAARGRSA
jgi:RNA-directed DNA polymerase